MSSDPFGIHRKQPTRAELFAQFGAAEPAALRAGYLSLPDQARVAHKGSTAPALIRQFIKTQNLWIPANHSAQRSPMDNMAAFMTGEELFGQIVPPAALQAAVGQCDRAEILVHCASALAKIVGDKAAERTAAIAFADCLVPKYQRRAKELIRQDRIVYTREAVLALAKLALVYGGDTHEAKFPVPALLPGWLVRLHDVFSALSPEFEQPAPGAVDEEMVSWMSANQALHATLEPAGLLSSFESTWAHADDPQIAAVLDAFKNTMGFTVLDQAAVALVCWGWVRQNGVLTFEREWLPSLGLDPKLIDQILAENSITLNEAAARIKEHEMGANDFNWNFQTFERWPLLRLTDTIYLLLDADMFLRKAMGWAPIYQLSGKGSGKHRYEAALEKAAENEAQASLTTAFGAAKPARLFSGAQLQTMKPGAKCADAAVDYGGRWAVIEVTAARVPQPARQGKAEGAPGMLEMVIRKLRQIDSTARLLTANRGVLTGEDDLSPIKIYPVVVTTEGFPTNPMTLTEVRRLAAEEGLFAGLDVGPIEVLDSSELEMLEVMVEDGGPTYPDLVDAKAHSNFWADSVRNYVSAEQVIANRFPNRLKEAYTSALTRFARYLQRPELDTL